MPRAISANGHSEPLHRAYEVSCRVRMGVHPAAVAPFPVLQRLHPKDTVSSAHIGSPALPASNCGPRAAAGLGVRPWAPGEEGSSGAPRRYLTKRPHVT